MAWMNRGPKLLWVKSCTERLALEKKLIHLHFYFILILPTESKCEIFKRETEINPEVFETLLLLLSPGRQTFAETFVSIEKVLLNFLYYEKYI